MTGQFLGRADSHPHAYFINQTTIRSDASPVELKAFCDYLLPSKNDPRWDITFIDPNVSMLNSSSPFAIAPNTTAGCLISGPPLPATAAPTGGSTSSGRTFLHGSHPSE